MCVRHDQMLLAWSNSDKQTCKSWKGWCGGPNDIVMYDDKTSAGETLDFQVKCVCVRVRVCQREIGSIQISPFFLHIEETFTRLEFICDLLQWSDDMPDFYFF